MAGGVGDVPWECVKKWYRIDRREIHYLRFVLEGYDGLAVLRTVDPDKGLVVVHAAPGCEDDVAAIVDDLGAQLKIEPVRDPLEQ
ncbi:MAG: DUF4911 domain-containing protein [Deltaproteobacteria bacterium]|nr:DUF4911 domain-containing protein [Deltaproteobacteria bacterium]